jgi:hypothetical protein
MAHSHETTMCGSFLGITYKNEVVKVGHVAAAIAYRLSLSSAVIL